MIRFRPLLLMTVLALVALAILIFLGRWQWERYLEKRALAAAPVAEMTIENYEPLEAGVQFVAGAMPDGTWGYRVFTPVRSGETIVFVDGDFSPGTDPPRASEMRAPASLRFGAPVRGAALRPGKPGLFAPAPRPAQRLWYYIDLPAMGRRAGLSNVADYYLATSYVGADGRALPNPFARPAGVETLPPERHLGYAFTWWGLALVLVGVYLAYHISVGRLSFAPREADE